MPTTHKQPRIPYERSHAHYLEATRLVTEARARAKAKAEAARLAADEAAATRRDQL